MATDAILLLNQSPQLEKGICVVMIVDFISYLSDINWTINCRFHIFQTLYRQNATGVLKRFFKTLK